MAAAESNEHECPVCHEDYIDPKILRCAHLVCHKCVIAWLRKEGDHAGCPLCRALILPASNVGQGDLSAAVDALPTDLMTASVVASQHMLNSPNRCVCNYSTEAKFLCLQCRIKLCNSCAKSHLKSPAIQHHNVEDLSDISAAKVAGFHQSSCSSHGNKTAELYCRSHQVLICMLCASSSHRQCLDVGGIEEEAKLQSEELKKQVERFKKKEKDIVERIKELDRLIADGKAKFQTMRAEVKTTFDDLQQKLEAQRQKVNHDLDQKEDAFVTEKKAPRAEMDMQRAGLGAHTNIMERVASASHNFQLGILSKLKSHLNDLESREIKDKASEYATEVENVSLDTVLLTALKELIGKLGEDAGDSSLCSLCRRCKTGVEGLKYAAVMKVGDRVRRGRDWKWGDQDGNPPGLGTITLISADSLKIDLAVQVKWDNGSLHNYRMGLNNKYDLQHA